MTIAERHHLPVASHRFPTMLRAHGRKLPSRDVVTTLQVNVGKRCNQACRHCHVDAGPNRSESMSAEVANRVIQLLAASPSVATLDITGGAPELNPSFRTLVMKARARGVEVIDRCNLTVLFEPEMEGLAGFLAEQGVHVVASLPCYTEENVDRQRGRGTFEKSVHALRLLNSLGYAARDELRLDLVYNPLGPSLPPPQAPLEQDYRERLAADFGVAFSRLLTLTNMPIHRFANDLARTGRQDAYWALLEESFNAATLPGLMCRSLVSVDYRGQLFDCDFNQVVGLRAGSGSDSPSTIWEIDCLDQLTGSSIAVADHCLGCTAGAGSSCSGSLA